MGLGLLRVLFAPLFFAHSVLLGTVTIRREHEAAQCVSPCVLDASHLLTWSFELRCGERREEFVLHAGEALECRIVASGGSVNPAPAPCFVARLIGPSLVEVQTRVLADGGSVLAIEGVHDPGEYALELMLTYENATLARGDPHEVPRMLRCLCSPLGRHEPASSPALPLGYEGPVSLRRAGALGDVTVLVVGEAPGAPRERCRGGQTASNSTTPPPGRWLRLDGARKGWLGGDEGVLFRGARYDWAPYDCELPRRGPWLYPGGYLGPAFAKLAAPRRGPHLAWCHRTLALGDSQQGRAFLQLASHDLPNVDGAVVLADVAGATQLDIGQGGWSAGGADSRTLHHRWWHEEGFEPAQSHLAIAMLERGVFRGMHPRPGSSALDSADARFDHRITPSRAAAADLARGHSRHGVALSATAVAARQRLLEACYFTPNSTQDRVSLGGLDLRNCLRSGAVRQLVLNTGHWDARDVSVREYAHALPRLLDTLDALVADADVSRLWRTTVPWAQRATSAIRFDPSAQRREYRTNEKLLTMDAVAKSAAAARGWAVFDSRQILAPLWTESADSHHYFNGKQSAGFVDHQLMFFYHGGCENDQAWRRDDLVPVT